MTTQAVGNVAFPPSSDVVDSIVKRGTATLVAGTVTVTPVPITTTSRILVSRKTSLGTLGFLSAPSASRVVGSAGSFVISSVSATDVSTVDWAVIG